MADRTGFRIAPQHSRRPDHQGLCTDSNHRHNRRRDHRRHPPWLEMTMRTFITALGLLTALFLSGCGGTDRRQPVDPAATRVPPFIELLSETSAGTIHFPR